MLLGRFKTLLSIVLVEPGKSFVGDCVLLIELVHRIDLMRLDFILEFTL